MPTGNVVSTSATALVSSSWSGRTRGRARRRDEQRVMPGAPQDGSRGIPVAQVVDDQIYDRERIGNETCHASGRS
jgi:hypothetical protein